MQHAFVTIILTLLAFGVGLELWAQRFKFLSGVLFVMGLLYFLYMVWLGLG